MGDMFYMRNKKIGLIMISIVVIIIVGWAVNKGADKNTVSTTDEEINKDTDKDAVSTVGGEIIKVFEGCVTFQANPNNLGSQYSVGTSNISIFDANGNRISVDELQKGKHILVEYTGPVLETLPAFIPDVIKIIIE